MGHYIPLRDYANHTDSPLRQDTFGVAHIISISQRTKRSSHPSGEGVQEGRHSYLPIKDGQECLSSCVARWNGTSRFDNI